MAVDMTPEKKRKEKETVLQYSNTIHSHLRLSKAFSVIPEKLSTYQKFCEIAKREAGSRGFSEVLLKAMAEYNQRHEEGNPQLKIASYLPSATAGPMRVICWRFLKGAMKDGQVLCSQSGEGRWINGVKCYSCRQNQFKRKSEIK